MLFYENPMKIEFNDDGLFVDGKKHEQNVRMLSKLQEALFSREPFKQDNPIYLMYREVYSRNDIRFDITIIASRILGKEYARTYGHYHPKAEDGISYPEVYQVLFGDAKFVLQKRNPDRSVDVTIVDATQGDVLLIPPGWGHVTVNPSLEKPLFLSNLVSSKFKSEYVPYKDNKGPAIYHTTDGIIYNSNYLVRQLDKVKTSDVNKKYGFSCEDAFKEFYENPEKFEFLNKPSLFFK